jgi:hypothetical protein
MTTRRDFDRATKYNFGCRMASDERRSYREGRRLPLVVLRDRLAERAYWRAGHPYLPTLAIESCFRAPVEWRLLGRLPRLPLTREERVARMGR